MSIGGGRAIGLGVGIIAGANRLNEISCLVAFSLISAVWGDVLGRA